MKQQGFTLIELMIVVGILSILMAIAYPFYRDYILRVRIANIIHDMTTAFKDAQVAYGIGDPASFMDVVDISKKNGIAIQKNYGCINGFYKIGMDIPKSKIPNVLGFSSQYVHSAFYSGVSQIPCSGAQSHDNTIQLFVHLDTEALGLGNKSGKKDVNSLHLSVSEIVVYKKLDGTEIRREVGSVLSCGVYARGNGALSDLDIPIRALPEMCRYYNVSGTTPRTLVELKAY